VATAQKSDTGPVGSSVVTSTDWAWKPIVTQQGVQVHYVFYSETGPKHEGVVLKIVNTRPQAIWYAFTIIFKAQGKVKEARVAGRVKANSFLTGESEGLYWTPFERGTSIGEIGIRGLSIK